VSKDEVHRVIKESPKEKAPDPYGFIGSFFSSYWGIIMEDMMRAVNHFFELNQQDLHMLNQAYIVLIPKKQNPQKVSEKIRGGHCLVNWATCLRPKRLGVRH
jgi:hypothetical protein